MNLLKEVRTAVPVVMLTGNAVVGAVVDRSAASTAGGCIR